MTGKPYPLLGAKPDGDATVETLDGVSYLYELCCSHALPFYVGITDHLGRRLADHAREKKWWPKVDLVNVAVFRDRAAAKMAETWHIRNTGPMHNDAEALGYPYLDGPDFVEFFTLSSSPDGWRSAHFGRLNPGSIGPLWLDPPLAPPLTPRQLLGLFGVAG